MARLKTGEFCPIPRNPQVYDALFAEYVQLHDYFGRGTNDVMKRLKAIRADRKGAPAVEPGK